MSQAHLGDEQSELWISLDEAVIRSGLSKRTILDWSRDGKVKREKRKGRIYLWVSDLVQLTPLTRTEPIEQSTQVHQVLPSVSSETYGGSNIVQIKLMGDQLKHNLEKQEQVLENVIQLQSTLERLESKEVLDERTRKELSLLGNVFRSLHQQNEKVNVALEVQSQSLNRFIEIHSDREILVQKIEKTNQRATTWFYSLVFGMVLFILLSSWLFREWSIDQKHALALVESEKSEKQRIHGELEKEKLELVELREKKELEMKTLSHQHLQVLEELKQEQKRSEQQSEMVHQAQLKEIQDKFLTLYEQKDRQLLEQLDKHKSDFEAYQKTLDQSKREELERLEVAHDKIIAELKLSESEKWKGRELEVKSILEELRSTKGMDQKLWQQRLQELNVMMEQFQVSKQEGKSELPSIKVESAPVLKAQDNLQK